MFPRPLAHRWTTQSPADLGRVQVQLGKGPAQGVAVHSQLVGSLALVALVLGKHLKQVTAFELPDRLGSRRFQRCAFETPSHPVRASR